MVCCVCAARVSKTCKGECVFHRGICARQSFVGNRSRYVQSVIFAARSSDTDECALDFSKFICKKSSMADGVISSICEGLTRERTCQIAKF